MLGNDQNIDFSIRCVETLTNAHLSMRRGPGESRVVGSDRRGRCGDALRGIQVFPALAGRATFLRAYGAAKA